MTVRPDNTTRIQQLESDLAALARRVSSMSPARMDLPEQVRIGKTAIGPNQSSYPIDTDTDTFGVIFRDEDFTESVGKQDLSGLDQSGVARRVARTIPPTYLEKGTQVVVVQSDDKFYIVGCCGDLDGGGGEFLPCPCLLSAGRGISQIYVRFKQVRNGNPSCPTCELWNDNWRFTRKVGTPDPSEECKYIVQQEAVLSQFPAPFPEWPAQAIFPCVNPETDDGDNFFELFIDAKLPCSANQNTVTMDVYINKDSADGRRKFFTAIWNNMSFQEQWLKADQIIVFTAVDGVDNGVVTGAHDVFPAWDPPTGITLKDNDPMYGCGDGFTVDLTSPPANFVLYNFGTAEVPRVVRLEDNDYVVYDGRQWVRLDNNNGAVPFDKYIPCELTALNDVYGCDWLDTIQDYNVEISFVEAQG